MFCFDYRQAVALDQVPELSTEALQTTVADALTQGWRVLAFFGLPVAARPCASASVPAGLCCILAHDSSQTLAAMRTAPLTAYPALTPLCPQVHYFERELYEQWGIMPEGHPWLKPVRRSPDCLVDGKVQDYPYYRVDGSEVHEVAVGPVHAGVIEPGHFRFQCHGETVMHLEIALGYQHRGLEDALSCGQEALLRARRLPLVECAAGDSSIAHATAHCVLWERLTGQYVPQRAQIVRRIALELERLACHAGDLGAIGGDTGFLPTSSWNGRIRGDFLNMTASLCGNRFGRTLLRYGGVAHDLDAAACADLSARVRSAGRDLRGAVDVMLDSLSVRDRLTDTGTLTAQQAQALGLVGVAARACGLLMDARRFAPLSDLPLEGTEPRLIHSGDVLARTLVRSHEVDDSLRLVLADLARLQDWEQHDAIPAASGALPLPPRMLAVAQMEGWRGEVCHVAVSGDDGELLACKIYDPSFHNWAGLALALREEQISDFPLCNKSFNLSYCGHDL